MEGVSQSPIPKKKEEQKRETMNFSEAIKMIILGKSISKEEWGDKEFYGILNKEDAILNLHKPDGKL
jgi:hypothetical protein